MIKRKIGKGLTIYKGSFFPKKYIYKRFRYESTIGVGGNISDVIRRLHKLLIFLQKDRRVSLKQTSIILKNPPFGFVDQDDFINTAIVVRTSMQPRAFMRYLLRVEKRFGRVRSFCNAPRTLDLDMLFFDNRTIEYPDLTVPHPSWSSRDSVLIPLSYLAR